MATHSSILARRTPWTEEPGGWEIERHDRATEQAILFPDGKVTANKQHF